MKFYGRTNEIGILRKIRNYSNESAQFTVITGRRRIGKTELIREAFGDKYVLRQGGKCKNFGRKCALSVNHRSADVFGRAFGVQGSELP